MMLTLQIAVGIWLGGMFLTGAFVAHYKITAMIERNKRLKYLGLGPRRWTYA